MRRRKLLSVILALSLCLTLPLGMAAAEETGTVKEVTSSQELTEALEGTAETVRLGANIEISESLTVRRTVTLDLNGCVLKMTNNGGSVIKVDSGGNLKLTDSDTTAAHKFTPDANGLWALDETAGTKTVTGGVITGGTGTNGPNGICGGGGVYVAEGGKFTMNGGNIAGCTVRASKGLALGGGVYVANGGEFTMTGGSIAGCTAQATSDDSGYAWGGGIRSEGTTTLSGRAEIRDCHAKAGTDSYASGGGVSDTNGVLLDISGNVKITGCTIDGKNEVRSDAMNIGYHGNISGGTFDGSVENNGKISGGTFNGKVTNSRTITEGTFNGAVTNEGSITGGTFNGGVTNGENGTISGATVVAKVSTDTEFLEALAKPYVTTIKLMGDEIRVNKAEAVEELTVDRAITLVNDSRAPNLYLWLPLTIAEGGALTLEGIVYLYPCDSVVVNGGVTVGAGCGVSFDGGSPSLVINEDGTVTTVKTTDAEKARSGQLSLGKNATLTVKGKLDNQGRLSISNMANLKTAADIGGDLILYGMTIDENYTLDMKGNLLTISGFLRFGNNANLTVVNASKVEATGVTLSGGSYHCPVTVGDNEGSITGGSFYGPVTVRGQGGGQSAPISGGTFYGGIKGTYAISGGTFYNGSFQEDFSLPEAGRINGRKVTYKNGEEVYAIQVVGGKASAPDAPSKDGYHLTGWYTEAGEEFDFEKDTVEKDITLTARWSKNAPGVSYASLRFETGGGSALPALSLPYGSAVDLTKYVPSREGFTFTGWYTDRELTKRVTSLTLTGSAAVYAGWNPFTDAGSGDWYYEDVLYVYNRGLMEGTGEHSFSPDGAVTRGQIVTILWRLAGSPVVNFAMDFTDVTEETWCAEAIRWAAAEGIAQGFDDGSFGQDRVVTREQLAAFLYREVQRQGGGFTGMWYFPLNYPDMEELGAFADEAMHWCVMTGVLQGTADGRLAPKDTADRAQLSAILHRYLTVEK